MANDAELLLRIGADIRQWERGLKRAEKGGRGFGKRMSNLTRSVGAKLGRAVTSPLAGLAGGAVVLKAAHDVMQFEASLTRLAMQGNQSVAQQMRLKDEIYNVATATGQSNTSILQGMNAIVERTGDIAFAGDVLSDMAVAATATGAPMEALGALASNLKEKMGLAHGEISQAFDVLTSQGKQGAFTLEKMAALGERLFSAAGRFDVRGMEGVKQFGALIQVAMKGAGSPEQAATAVEAMLADIIDKQKQIRKHAGFSIFKAGTRDLKRIDEVLKGIIRGTGGDITKLQQIFGRESIRGISELAKLYKRTGGFDFFDKLAKGGQAGEVMRDFGRYSKTAAFQFQQLRNVAGVLADSALSPILAEITEHISELTANPQRMAELTENIRNFGVGLGKIVKLAGDLANSPLVKTMLWSPFFETVEWADAQANLQGVKGQRGTRAAAMFNMLPDEERMAALQRLKEGKKVNIERLGFEHQTHLQQRAEAVKNDINLVVEVHDDGRVQTRSDDMNTSVRAELRNKRGDMGVVGH